MNSIESKEDTGSSHSHSVTVGTKSKRNRWGPPKPCDDEDDIAVENLVVNHATDTATTVPTNTTTTTIDGVGTVGNSTTSTAAVTTTVTTERKRKSRWAAAAPVTDSDSVASAIAAATAAAAAAAARQPMRFEPKPITPEIMQEILILKLQLQQVNQKLFTVIRDAKMIEEDPNRSPSPPPKYDSNGKRTNTRELRMRDAFNQERIHIIETLAKLDPTFIPPMDFMKTKPSKKIYLPKHVDPLFNYIGLIIGPRGNTQKQMEQETGTKISIRGKGSAKEGSKGRASKAIDEDEELHVHISGETDESVERAAKMIYDIISPDEEALNEHKQKQLRELALINGTLREDEYCPVCGEKGHRQFECPHRAKSFKAAGVKCAICGDLSHPTRDCPMKQDGPTNQASIDNEYDSFMAELTGGAKEEKQSTGSTNNTGTVLANNGKTQVVAPIVDVLSRKPQTIINVTSVMTGAGMPSYMSASMPPIATAPTAPTGANSNNPWAAYMNNGAYAGMYGAYPTMQTAQGYYPPAAYNYGYNYPGYYGMPTDGANPPPLPGAPPPPDFGSTPSPRNNGSYFPPPNSG